MLAAHWRWLVLAGVVAVQTAALYLPWPQAASPSFPHSDKITHFMLFAVVAVVAVWAGVSWPIAVVVLIGQAVASELVQHFLLSERRGEWGDVVADVLGIAAGASVAWVLRLAPQAVPEH